MIHALTSCPVLVEARNLDASLGDQGSRTDWTRTNDYCIYSICYLSMHPMYVSYVCMYVCMCPLPMNNGEKMAWLERFDTVWRAAWSTTSSTWCAKWRRRQGLTEASSQRISGEREAVTRRRLRGAYTSAKTSSRSVPHVASSEPT